MTSLKFLLLAGIVTSLGCSPAWAGTTTQNDAIKRGPATDLGGAVKPSITIFPKTADQNAAQTTDLNLQLSGKQPLSKTANPDIWESELLDEQRRTDPGFFTITSD